MRKQKNCHVLLFKIKRKKNRFHVEGLKKISSNDLLLYLFYLFIHSEIMNVILIVQIINIRGQKRLI